MKKFKNWRWLMQCLKQKSQTLMVAFRSFKSALMERMRLLGYFQQASKNSGELLNSPQVLVSKEESVMISRTGEMKIDDNIITVAKQHGIEPEIVAAICHIESATFSAAARFEEHYRYTYHPEKFAKMNRISIKTETMFQKTSWGLMQVMGGVARENGYNGFLPHLCEPRIGLTWGCIHLAKLLKRYPLLVDTVSAYNAGSPRKNDEGVYVNDKYVKKFFNIYSKLGGNYNV